MSRRFPGRRARNAVSIVLVFVLLMAGALAFELQRRYEWAATTLEEITPRYARIAGVQQVEGEISQALQASQETLAQFVHPASEPVERIGTALQERVRALATDHGMAVSNSTVLPLVAGDVVDVLGVTMTVQGTAVQLRDLLLAMQLERPALQLDSVQISMARGRVQSDRFSAQLTISTLRIRS